MNAQITRFGLKNPSATMEAFHEIGSDTLTQILKMSATPESTKTLRTWGIYSAAEMIGKSSQTIRQLERKGGILGEPEIINGKRIYTLERINWIRDKLGTRYKRPTHSRPMKVAVSNFKGGVAKTTTSILLAQKCALTGLKVLVIDLDPQATTTLLFGYLPDTHIEEEDTLTKTLSEDPNDMQRVIKQTYFTGIDFIPANLDLQFVEFLLPHSSNEPNGLYKGIPIIARLKHALSTVENNYDVIIFDCGPNLGALTMNAVAAANGMLVPLPPAMANFGSFVRLTKTLSQLFTHVEVNLEFFRLLLTKHTGSNAALQLDTIMRKKFGELMLVNHMVETVEIENTNNSLSSLYEKPAIGTNSKAYRRALEYADKVNEEIIAAFKEIWEAQHNSWLSEQGYLPTEKVANYVEKISDSA